MKRSLQPYNQNIKRRRINKDQEFKKRAIHEGIEFIANHHLHNRNDVIEWVILILEIIPERKFKDVVFGYLYNRENEIRFKRGGINGRPGLLDKVHYESEYKQFYLDTIRRYLTIIDEYTFADIMNYFEL